MQNKIPIYVTTCDHFRHLCLPFAKLFNKFWDPNREVTIFGNLPPEEELPPNFKFISLGFGQLPWSDQMIAFGKWAQDNLKEQFIILLHEDFFLLEPVDLKQLAELEEYALSHENIGRIGLQCLWDGYQGFTNKYDKTPGGVELFQLDLHAMYRCSLEASIFNKDFIFRYMKPGENTAHAEVEMSIRARGNPAPCLVTDKRTLVYKDARIGGGDRIKFVDGYLHLLTQGPDGNDLWVNKGIKI